MRKSATALLALIAWTGLLIQLWLSLHIGNGVVRGLVGYFGYFTITTNLFVALATTLPLVAPLSKAGKWFARPAVFGCAVTAITGVGIAYHILLRHVWNPQGLQLVADMTLHYVVPIAAFVHWLIFPPDGKISWSWPLKWCAYPLGYVIYAMIRGAIIGSYPYYFVDVAKLGYGRVLLNSLGLGAFFLVLGFAVTGIAFLRRKAQRS